MKIVGTDLEAWAQRMDSRSLLPELIRRLIHGTIPLSDIGLIDFPSGEGVGKHGVDGRVIVREGHAFVPPGASVWEMGVSKDFKGKANRDYEARRDDPGPGIDPKQTTFVFVTPRRWYNHEEWATEKRKDGLWADVRVLDADSLEQWLDLAPAARAWVGPRVGKAPDAQELEDWWQEWSLQTDPPTSPTLVYGQREQGEHEVLAWLASPPAERVAKVEEPTEAIAFLYACVRRLPPSERPAILDRTLVVPDADTLRRAAVHPSGLIIAVASGQNELAGLSRTAVAKGHHVLRTSPAPGPKDRLDLGPIDPKVAAVALEQMNLPKVQAEEYAKQAKGSLTQIRRLLGDLREFPAELAPWVLVGGWSETNEQDEAVIAQIVGRDVTFVREMVRRYSAGPNTVWVRVDNTVRWASHLVAFRALANGLAAPDLERFVKAVIDVLKIPDPRYELEPSVQFAAAMYGKTLPHSRELREGLLETLVLLATAAESLRDGLDGQGYADRIVRLLLKACTRREHWSTLDRQLPSLAEASPMAVLATIRQGVESAPDLMKEVLRVEPTRFGGNYNVGLVWALETLAWSPEHLPEAAMLLARLAALDPGGNSHPRPAGALVSIFLPWYPQTMADLDGRIGALEAVAKHVPEVAVKVILDLFRKETTSSTHRPAVRMWAAGWQEGVSVGELAATHERISALAIATADTHPELWSLLVTQLGMFPDSVRGDGYHYLANLELTSMADDLRDGLRKAVRMALHYGVRHPDSARAPTQAEREVLNTLLERLTPMDLREVHRWLLDRIVHLPDVSEFPWAEMGKELRKRQIAAGRELAQAFSTHDILAFAESVSRRSELGFVIAGESTHHDLVIDLIKASFSTSESSEAQAARREFRDGLVVALHSLNPERFWLDLLEPSGAFASLSVVQRADLLVPLGAPPGIWPTLETLGDEAKAAYWGRMEPMLVQEEDTEFAVRQLLKWKLPQKALTFAGMRAEQLVSQNPPLAVRVLDDAATSEPEEGPGQTGRHSYHVASLLKHLVESDGASREELFRLEWLWLPLVEHEYQPSVLFQELGENPEHFVEMLCFLFRGDDEENVPPSEIEVLRARHAGQVLGAWHQLPGTRADGSIDKDQLRSWVTKARELLRERKRKAIGDERIGAVLAECPVGADGYWPHEAVRDVIEGLNDVSHIQTGFRVGRYNQRGVMWRDPETGGAAERAIGERYAAAATALRTRWPTTARFLESLARSYEEDGKSEDRDTRRMLERYSSSPRAQDRVRVFMDELQTRGQYTFGLAELAEEIEMNERDALEAATTLVRDRRLVAPQPDFFVIVPPQYRPVEAPPPSWYLDKWMAFAGMPYAVGLLTAASHHGASEQAAQVFQVLVPSAMEPATVGRVRFEFVVDTKAGSDFGVVGERTTTGSMRVTTPNRTLWDLVEHADAVGGIDLAARVIDELVSEVTELTAMGETTGDLSGAGLASYAEHYGIEVAQRLGWILEHLGHGRLARNLREVVVNQSAAPVSLRRSIPLDPSSGQPAQPPWQVWTDSPLETDS